MGKEFLLEIGTEEIPAGFINPGLERFKEIFIKFLNDEKLQYESVETFGTPRRLIVVIKDLIEKQEDSVLEKTGPAKNVAIDANGEYTKAAQGFARSQGVDVGELITVSTAKGEYIAVKKVIKGRPAFELLKENLPILIKKLIFPKNMRWGSETISFARPIHWILSLFGGEIVPFEYGSIKASNYSFGHRFLAPEKITVSCFRELCEELKSRYVLIDYNERKEKLFSEVKNIAQGLGGKIEDDEELLETVTNLVEFPFPVAGKIDEEFLQLPEEVIITSMKVHQKYFPVYSDKDRLLPYFITVSNTKAKNMDIVAKGNEKVLRARLNDAKFFFDEDRKQKLDSFVERLRNVVFQKDIGTSYEKMERFKELAVYIASLINPEAEKITERAAYLCKGDLESSMVYEFPELQGIMGKYYALYSGEKKAVADAIYEHYLPRYAEDAIPSGDAGAFISIADRIDTITGFFGIGKIPSGTADPYALRRHAIAIINIITGKKYRLSLKDVLNRSRVLYTGKIDVTRETVDKITEFFAQRFQNLFVEKYSFDVVNSVISVNFDDIYETFLRVEAVSGIKKDKDFMDIIVPFKRVANITKDWETKVVDRSLLVEGEEKELYQKFTEIKEKFENFKKSENYTEALKTFTLLKEPVNKFFDSVLVMDKDEKIKTNRLNMLKDIYTVFNSIADLTLLQ